MANLSISDRMLKSLTECFTPEVAQRIVDAKIDAEMQAQIDDLASKANHGSLTQEEQADYAAIVEYIDLIGIIKAKARVILRRHAT